MKNIPRRIDGNSSIYIIDNFISAKECASIIKIAKKQGLKKAKQASIYSKSRSNRNIRDNTVAWLCADQYELLAHIEKRIFNIVKLPKEYGKEYFQVAHYTKGGFFDPHFDVLPGRSRYLTFLIYLNDVKKGGETAFPELGIQFIPKQGRAIIWYNYADLSLPSSSKKKLVKIPKNVIIDPNTCHGAQPVEKGEKWIVTKWFSDPADFLDK